MRLPMLSVPPIARRITLPSVLGTNYVPIGGEDEMSISRRAEGCHLGRFNLPLLSQNFLNSICTITWPVFLGLQKVLSLQLKENLQYIVWLPE